MIDRDSGREVFACEFGFDNCSHTKCKAIKCPWGYCQRYYACPNCYKQAKQAHKQKHNKSNNDTCYIGSIEHKKKETEKQNILDSGAFVRCSALAKEGNTIHVLFRNEEDETVGYFMSAEAYHSIPYGVNATIEDYKKNFEVLQAPNNFY